MDPKHATLIKKAIRMIDYMRADLVGILGESGAISQPGTADGDINALRPSPLYVAFDTATAVQPDPVEQHVADVLGEPVENTDPAPSPPAPEITEYERLKRQLHASFRQNETMVCCAQHAPLGVSCRCPKCTGE